eukprot:gene27498-36283_t
MFDGEEMRSVCIQGNGDRLREIMRTIPNPCSTDIHRLSPLHYAVWNGHLECVKLLVANDRGVDYNGIRCSCLNLRSTMGFTALHLAVLDAPTKHLQDIIRLLLIVGSDLSIESNSGMTAHAVALEQSNQVALDTFEEFQKAAADATIQDKYLEIINALREGSRKVQYNFQPDAKIYRRTVEKWDAEFSLPEFLFERERVGYIPRELTIHEHQIRPLIEEGFDIHNINKHSEEFQLIQQEINGISEGDTPQTSTTVQALRCLDFARDQAMVNRDRRRKLLTESAPDWSSPLQVEEALKLNKYEKKKSHKS